MEGNGLSTTRMYSNLGSGMLGLEMPLHPQNQQQQQQQQQQQHFLQKQKHTQIMGFSQQQQQLLDQQQTQLTMKQPNFNNNNNNNSNPGTNPGLKPKIQMTQLTNSGDEDDQGYTNENENNSGDLKRKRGSNSVSSNMSPWQRMKWTDNMVRLLIMAVYYIGDEAGGSEPVPDKKKPGSGGGSGNGGGGALQKKGKWKSVSRAMMEKGFYVSPQQCEDKFNDLNKRYKRVNDILGRGTACKVVENQSLLESMEISPKMKEEVKKLLNSKHLFFREMCAYHNSCGHSTNNANSGSCEPAAAAVVSSPGQIQQFHQQHSPQQPPLQQHQHQQQPQSCLHAAQMQHSSSMTDHHHRGRVVETEEDHEDEEEEDEDEDDDEEDEDEDEEDEGVEDHHHEEEGHAVKRARTGTGANALHNLNGDMMRMVQDGSKSAWEKKHWVMTQRVQMEENGVKFQRQALELEKDRLKWMKYSSKKEREMERMRIENEKKKLENDKMVLLLRKKEIEFLFVEQHPSNPSCVSS